MIIIQGTWLTKFWMFSTITIDCILSTQHIHLDHHNCFEIIVTKGKATEIEKLYMKLKSIKSVKHAGFLMATKGKDLT